MPLFSNVKQYLLYVRENEETRDCDRRADIKRKNIVPDIYLYTEANKLLNRSWNPRLLPRVVWPAWIFAAMESLEKKTGCMKVQDPYFGKRKPSTTLKRIHRKMSLLESQKKEEQVNQERSSSTTPSSTRTVLPSLREIKQDEVQSRSNEELSRLTITAIPRQHRASTAPGELSTSTLTKDPWPTKDDFETLLFRMIWASFARVYPGIEWNSGVILNSLFWF